MDRKIKMRMGKIIDPFYFNYFKIQDSTKIGMYFYFQSFEVRFN